MSGHSTQHTHCCCYSRSGGCADIPGVLQEEGDCFLLTGVLLCCKLCPGSFSHFPSTDLSLWLLWSHCSQSWKYGLFSDSLWWWVKRLFLPRGEEVFKLVWFLVNSKAYRDPEEMPDISPKMTFLLVFWRSELSMFTGQDLVLWILKVFKMFDLHFNWILWCLVKKKK